jgi:hypothetical protein
MRIKPIQKLRFCAVAICLALESASSGSEQRNPSDVLATLRSYDASMLNNFTLSAHVVNPRPLRPVPESERLVYNTSLTAKDGVWAASRVLDETVPLPKMKDVRTSGLDELDFERSGNLFVIRALRRSALYEPGYHGVYVENIAYVVSPGNKVESKAAAAHVELYKHVAGIDKSNDIYVPLLLAAGRGYGHLIDEIVEVGQMMNGLVQCRARGHYPDARPCVLTVWVDLEAAYLVRRARCERADNSYLVFELTNEGVQWTGNGCIPKNAKFVFDPKEYSSRSDGAFEIRFGQLTIQADQALIEANRRLLHRDKYADHTRMFDYRSGSLEISTVGFKPTIGTK